MAPWGEVRAARPDLAEASRALLYQVGVGLAFLATTTADGGPRVHPICPLLAGEELYAFIVPSPKRADLRRNGRFALHSFPTDDDEDSCYLVGRVEEVVDAEVRATLVQQFVEERAAFEVPAESLDDQVLFRFEVERLLLTTTTGHGDPAPHHDLWIA